MSTAVLSNDYQTLFNFDHIDKSTQEHLQKVYATLALGWLSTALGALVVVYGYYQFGWLALLGSLACILYLMFTTPTDQNVFSRMFALLLFGFFTGLGLGPFIIISTQINPQIVPTAILITSGIFFSFSIAALFNKSRSFLYMGEDIWCRQINAEQIICNGTEFIKYEPPLDIFDYYFWIYLGIYVLLILGAGLMSGLTLGLLSLDALTLEILMRAGAEPEAKYAKKLYPIIKRHHILLVTLLLANAACVESMPLFLDRISNPITAVSVSVTAVLIFGEVIPQALCKRYGLAIGFYMRPIVYFLMGVTLIVGYPISKLLDCIFGHNNSNYYRRPQLKALIDLHGPTGLIVKSYERRSYRSSKQYENDDEESIYEEVINNSNDHHLSIEEVNIIKGALDLTTMTAKDALVPLDHVFMLSDKGILDKQTLHQILLVAHSRIPVFMGSERRLIQGILLTKMLIQFNSSENIKIEELIYNNKCFQPLRYVTETTPLYDLLQLFKTGKTGHMAVVVKNDIADEQLDALERFYSIRNDKVSSNLVSVFPPVLANKNLKRYAVAVHQWQFIKIFLENISPSYRHMEVIGIITLEDVMEKLIQSEITDEGDIFRHDICRRLIYKQKLRWAKFKVTKGMTLENEFTNKRIGDSEIINEYVSNHFEPTNKDLDDQIHLLSPVQPQNYRTFLNV